MSTNLLRVVLGSLAAVALLYGLHRLALWAERKGWLYYRDRRGSPGRVGNAFLEVQALLEPQQEHLVEARRADADENDESGDPPEPVT